jgi:hypothetical protein
MTKEAVIAYFNALPQHLFGVAEENYGKSENFWLVGQDLNLGSSDYVVRALITHL